ncbi:hypothetical protein HAX54_031341, partial [Datura stramonium]|nr:hypothetical protein [Datura stramonium]
MNWQHHRNTSVPREGIRGSPRNRRWEAENWGSRYSTDNRSADHRSRSTNHQYNTGSRKWPETNISQTGVPLVFHRTRP